jgi:hypothetical protein
MLPCLFFSGIKIIAQQVFKLAKEKDGIRIWVGSVSGSSYFAFKAEMSLEASEADIVKILKDVRRYPDWFAFTSSVKLISQNETNHQFVLETDYPWPYANECMQFTMNFDAKKDNKRIITITGNNSATNCKFTLKKASGFILLEQKGGNTTITYYFHSEPSQKIPSWLINPRIHEMPFQTFLALKRIVLLNQRPFLK